MAEKKIHKRFSLEVEITPRDFEVRVTWSGAVSDLDPGRFLKGVFDDALAMARETGVPIHMDLRTLEFINSSGLAYLARFLRESAAQKQKVVLVYDGAEAWQEISIGPLEALATDDGLVEVRLPIPQDDA